MCQTCYQLPGCRAGCKTSKSRESFVRKEKYACVSAFQIVLSLSELNFWGKKKKCKYLWSGKECRSGEVRGSDVCAPVFSYTGSLRGPRERGSQLSAGGEPRRVPRRAPRADAGRASNAHSTRQAPEGPPGCPPHVGQLDTRPGTGHGRGPRTARRPVVMSLACRLRVRARLSSLVACGSAV